jgi:periplasmic divalent cation tolerance protein
MNKPESRAVIMAGNGTPTWMKRHEYQLVLTTCPDTEVAERLAQALVQERLAACVNILPIAKSVYWWKGQVESAAEQLLIIKSMTDAYGSIQKRIRELHPYELPEVIAVPIADGLPDYLAWIRNPDKK